MARFFVGIDVGLTGGVALTDESQTLISLVRFDKVDALDVLEAAFSASGVHKLDIAVEAVGSRPDQNISSMFNFGASYGRIQGFLRAHKLDTTYYYPQSWQKYLPHADTPKERVRTFIEQKFSFEPFIFEGCRVPHQGCMDAAAIAIYHSLIVTGKLAAPKPTKKSKPRKAMKF